MSERPMMGSGKAWSVRPPLVTAREAAKWSLVGQDRKSGTDEDACCLLLYGIILRLAEDLSMMRHRGFWQDKPQEMRGVNCKTTDTAGHVTIRGQECLSALEHPALDEWLEYLSVWLRRTIDREWIVRRAKAHNPATWLRKSHPLKSKGVAA